MTSQEDCNCDDQCAESTSCICLYVYDTGRCTCDCFGPIVITPTLRLADRVAVNTREATLASLGESLGRSCAVELLIPGTRASERLSVSIRDATLQYVVENVGLVVGGPRAPQKD
jgi:hypothetical protein